jgi:amidohydrolase
MLSDLVRLRRELHAAPEVGLDLPRTQRAVLAALAGLDLQIATGAALSSVVAVLRGGRPGPTVLLRADMDALPVVERTGLDFASTNGAMHACGHDLHTAALVGAARLLHERRAELPGSVVLAFQPGEEGHGGARLMLAEGLLDAAGERPVAAYAVHVDSLTECGLFATRAGTIMASAGGIRLRVHGTGGHAARPHDVIDPVPPAAEIVLAIQTFVARRIPVADPAVLSVTRLATDSPASNVIPSTVEIGVSVRTLSRETLELVRTGVPALAVGIGTAHGCEVDAEFVASYPVTVNDATETAHALAVLDDLHGPDRVHRLAAPSMASEDFAHILDEVPGAMVFLGARPPGAAPGPVHSPTARFDDSVLEVQAAALAELAWRRLTRTARAARP